MFKLRKKIEETDERILILEKRLEDYRKEIIWRIQLESKLRNDFELKATDDIKAINKKIKKVAK